MSGLFTPGHIKHLDLNLIVADPALQMRVNRNIDALDSYVDAIADGKELPPVMTFFDGTSYWLADGFHRLEAHKRLSKATIRAEVRPGTRDNAFLFALSANAENGLQRTNADKRKAVLAALADPKIGRESDRQIAAHCRVSHTFVQNVRADMTGGVQSPVTVRVPEQTALPPAPPAIGWPDDEKGRIRWVSECEDTEILSRALMQKHSPDLTFALEKQRGWLESLSRLESAEILKSFEKLVGYNYPRERDVVRETIVCRRLAALATLPVPFPPDQIGTEIGHLEEAIDACDAKWSVDDFRLLLEIYAVSLISRRSGRDAQISLLKLPLPEKLHGIVQAKLNSLEAKREEAAEPAQRRPLYLIQTADLGAALTALEFDKSNIDEVASAFCNCSPHIDTERAALYTGWLAAAGVEFETCPWPACAGQEVVQGRYCPRCRMRSEDAKKRWVNHKNTVLLNLVGIDDFAKTIWSLLEDLENVGDNDEVCPVCNTEYDRGTRRHTSTCPVPKASLWIDPLARVLSGKLAFPDAELEADLPDEEDGDPEEDPELTGGGELD